MKTICQEHFDETRTKYLSCLSWDKKKEESTRCIYSSSPKHSIETYFGTIKKSLGLPECGAEDVNTCNGASCQTKLFKGDV